MGITTYQSVSIEPFKIKHIKYFKIVKKQNEHTQLILTGVLDEKLKDSYVEETLAMKTIKIKAMLPKKGNKNQKTELEEKVIFSGVVKNIEINAKEGLYSIGIEAVSHSYQLDIEKIDRSYQKLDMPYSTLMSQCVEKYIGAEVMDKATNKKTIEKFTLQYHETVWEFLKRMVSRFNSTLIVEDILDQPKIYAGMPNKTEIGNLEDYLYNIRKETYKYRDSKENFNESVSESDYIYYEIVSNDVYEIGNKVKFKQRSLYINEAVIEMVNGSLQNKYKITDKSGFHQNKIRNEQLAGISIEGKVIAVEKDTVKIFLDIDQERGQSVSDACLFKYGTMYTSDNGGGFYCMPELEEKVRLYFSDCDEENAVSSSSVRVSFATGEERGNPDIKYWRTKDGKEIMFTPSGIHIRCTDNEIFINLTVEDGILMQSSKPINIVAEKGAGIELSAEGKIILSADEELDLFCSSSRLNMKGGITQLKGNSIESN